MDQLGHRVRHALRAFAPHDEKGQRAARALPKTEFYDVAETLTTLGTGEALITTLSKNGGRSHRSPHGDSIGREHRRTKRRRA